MAAESKLIPTTTIFSVVGESISITTFYQEDELPDTILAEITDSVGIKDSVPFIEGELLIEMKNYLDHIDYQIDINGNLILLISTGDESNYSIDNDGNLIYTIP